MNDVGHFQLRAIEAALLQHINHADHAVHGSSDLVAHGGQELRLGAVGFFGLECGNLEGGVFFFKRLVQLLLEIEHTCGLRMGALGQLLLVSPVNRVDKVQGR